MDVSSCSLDSFYSNDDNNNSGHISIHKNNTNGSSSSSIHNNHNNNELSRSRRNRPKRRGSLTKTDVFANESMTSFRVSRRSKLSPDDFMPVSSRHSSKHGGGQSHHDSFQSFNTTSSEGLEGSAKTLILEEIFQESDADLGMAVDTRKKNSNHQSQNGDTTNNIDKGGDRSTSSDDEVDPNDSWISRNSSHPDRNDSVAVVEEPKDWKIKWLLRLAIVRASCGNFVNSLPVQVFMSIVIVANAILLGALTYESLPALTLRILEGTDLGMLCIFTSEIALHGVYLGPRQLIKDSWLAFDFIVVLLSWAFMGSSLTVLRSFRIFRIFSLFSRWESLRTLFEAIGSTLPKMASIWLSLLICTYTPHGQITNN